MCLYEKFLNFFPFFYIFLRKLRKLIFNSIQKGAYYEKNYR